MKQKLTKAAIYLRRSMYVTVASVDRLLQKKTPLFILCYHGVDNDGWRFSIPYRTLRKQILYLQQHYAIISLEEVQKYIDGKKKITKPSVVITFDDGYKDLLQTKAFFKKLGIKPALFVLAVPRKANRTELANGKQFLTKTDITSLAKAGWSIGCHSATHANLATVPEEQLSYEISQAKRKLERELGLSISYFAYPKGKYRPEVLGEVRRAGYQLALTMDDTAITPGMNPLTLPRIGVDSTHNFLEFTALMSPTSIGIRNMIKSSPVGGLL